MCVCVCVCQEKGTLSLEKTVVHFLGYGANSVTHHPNKDLHKLDVL